MKWIKSNKNNNKHQSTSSPEQKQGEKLAAMGAQLSALRQEKGLSLEEIVILTRIPRRLLQAIEEGNLEELPEPIYIQGLIRQYADALGLNGAEFSSSFPIGISRVSMKPIWNNTPISELRPIHLYLLYIFLIVCSVTGLSQLLNTKSLQAANNNQSQQKLEKQAIFSPPVTQKAKIQNIQPVSNIVGSKVQQVEIGVTLTKKSWIQVIVDGKIDYEGELPEGTQRTWKAQEQLTMRTDNAGGVLVSVNQQKAKQLGEPGKEKEVTIAANTR